ncbi:MAG: hypothetical protein ACF788_10400, partial [Novipirellula sp. JB048]
MLRIQRASLILISFIIPQTLFVLHLFVIQSIHPLFRLQSSCGGLATRLGSRRVAAAPSGSSRWRSTLGLLVAFWLAAGGGATLWSQGPGTEPPREILQSGRDSVEGGSGSPLRVKGFLFLDNTGVPVLMPGTSFEEIERLQNMEAGVEARSQVFDFQSLEITGTASRSRAELRIVIRLTIDSTSGRTVAIPLRMRNFFPLGPPDVSGLDEFRMTVSGNDSGHLLMVKTNRRREAVITMNVAARVDPGPTHALHFQLPDVPALVRITTEEEQVTGEIVGRGDEVMQTQREPGRPAQFVIESGGGAFSLRWGKRDRASDGTPLLEVDNSRIVVQWDSPQDQPVASCQMIIRSVRGTINAVQVRLPENAVLLDAPTLGPNGQTVELASPTAAPLPANNGEGALLDLIIPEQERQQRIDLNFEIQFSSSEANAATPLAFLAPEVLGALRQRGEIQISTGDDYRLRWRSRPWVQSILGQADDESGRSYLFRYDRASFELPIWLATTRRQLRLSTDSEISLHDSIARIKYRIVFSGRAAEGAMLKVDLGSWRLRSIENEDTSQQIESGLNGKHHEIYLESVPNGDPSPIRIVAEHDLPEFSKAALLASGTSPEKIVFDLPHVAEIEDTMLVQSSTVSVANQGRLSFVVNLESSQNIDRVIQVDNAATVETPRSNYRVIPPDAASQLIGRIVQQSPTISLAGDASIEVEGRSLRTTLDWIVNSSLDLEGRLPIQIPGFAGPAAVSTANPAPESAAGNPTANGSTANGATANGATSTGPTANEPDPDGPDPNGRDLNESDPDEPTANGASDTATQAVVAEAATDTAGPEDGDDGEKEDGEDDAAHLPSDWVVTVNNRPAVLESRGDDRFELISDQLSSGSMAIRWKSLRPLSEPRSENHIETVSIPRPFGVDTTFRGTMRVLLQGDAVTEILAADAIGHYGNDLESESAAEPPTIPPTPHRSGDRATL